MLANLKGGVIRYEFWEEGKGYLIYLAIVTNNRTAGIGPRVLLLRRRSAIRDDLLGLRLCPRNDIRLVDGPLDYLLFVWVEVLCQILVQGRLLLL